MQEENDFFMYFLSKKFEINETKQKKTWKKELFPWVLPEVIKIVMWDKCRTWEKAIILK